MLSTNLNIVHDSRPVTGLLICFKNKYFSNNFYCNGDSLRINEIIYLIKLYKSTYK